MSRFKLFLIYFAYSLIVAIVFQKFIATNLNHGNTLGLIGNDSIYFHQKALELAKAINLEGWSAWSPFPTASSSINVSILGAIYKSFGPTPSLMLPINALVHAFSGLVVFNLATTLSNNYKTGLIAGISSATLFVLSPSALNWYGQMHKDGWLILGVLLVVLSISNVIKSDYAIDKKLKYCFIKNIIFMFTGVTLIAVSRPYSLKLLSVTISIYLLIYLILNARKYKSKLASLSFIGLTLLLSLNLNIYIGKYFTNANQGDSYANFMTTDNWSWNKTPYIPSIIDSHIELASKSRVGFIYNGKLNEGKSFVDENITPQNASDAIYYIPRALQIGVFSPFPNTWFKELSALKLVAILEMSVTYFCLLGLLFLYRVDKKQPLIFVGIFSICFLAILGYTNANIGTLYRVRFGYEFLLIMLGIIGWVSWLDKKSVLNSNFFHKSTTVNTLDLHHENQTTDIFLSPVKANRKSILQSGFILAGLTFVGFLLFFIRDIYLAKTFGLSSSLDAFFISFLIPMFAVSVLSTPFGYAFIPSYESIRSLKSIDESTYIRKISSATFIVAILLSVVLFFLTPAILNWFKYDFPPNISSTINSYMFYIPIGVFLFSGQVILGNSILNALNKSHIPALSQLVVPIIAISSIFIFGDNYDVASVLVAMLLGQLLNYLIVYYQLKKSGIDIAPQWNAKFDIKALNFNGLYIPLVASAFFTAIAPTVSTFFTLNLPPSNLSAFNLGNKVILFITGLLSTLISTILLPYFSKLIANSHKSSAKDELSFFVSLSNLFAIPISTAIFIFASEIASLLFSGEKISYADIDLISRVIQYAVIQVPFFLTGLIFLKFCIASKRVKLVFIISLLSLILNIGISYLLLKFMGINGVVLAYTVSIIFSAICISILSSVYQHYPLKSLINLLITWLMFLCLLTNMHFNNITGIYSVVFLYLSFFLSEFKTDIAESISKAKGMVKIKNV